MISLTNISLVTPNSRLSKVIGGNIAGGEGVWEISPLTVAYVGIPSSLYVSFRSPDEGKYFHSPSGLEANANNFLSTEAKFRADFESVKKIAEYPS